MFLGTFYFPPSLNASSLSVTILKKKFGTQLRKRRWFFSKKMRGKWKTGGHELQVGPGFWAVFCNFPQGLPAFTCYFGGTTNSAPTWSTHLSPTRVGPIGPMFRAPLRKRSKNWCFARPQETQWELMFGAPSENMIKLEAPMAMTKHCKKCTLAFWERFGNSKKNPGFRQG